MLAVEALLVDTATCPTAKVHEYTERNHHDGHHRGKVNSVVVVRESIIEARYSDTLSQVELCDRANGTLKTGWEVEVAGVEGFLKFSRGSAVLIWAVWVMAGVTYLLKGSGNSSCTLQLTLEIICMVLHITFRVPRSPERGRRAS